MDLPARSDLFHRLCDGTAEDALSRPRAAAPGALRRDGAAWFDPADEASEAAADQAGVACRDEKGHPDAAGNRVPNRHPRPRAEV
jgi:hypothetical protein